MRLKLVRTLVLSSSLAALSLFGATSSALAYGSTDQWQIGVRENLCLPQRASGFWAWCAFDGSNGSSAVGTTGTAGDCHSSNYFFSTKLGASTQSVRVQRGHRRLGRRNRKPDGPSGHCVILSHGWDRRSNRSGRVDSPRLV